jgi:hypothetical protein
MGKYVQAQQNMFNVYGAPHLAIWVSENGVHLLNRNFNRKMIEGYDNPLGFGSFTYQAFTQKIRSWRINMIKYVRQLIPLSHHTCKNDRLNKQHRGSRMVICPTLLKKTSNRSGMLNKSDSSATWEKTKRVGIW